MRMSYQADKTKPASPQSTPARPGSDISSGPRGESRFDEDARVHDIVRQAGERANHRPEDRLIGRHRGFHQVEGILPRLCPRHDMPVSGRGLNGAVVQVELAHACPCLLRRTRLSTAKAYPAE